MSVDELAGVAQALSAPPRGILAADESHATIAKRFADIGVEATQDNRRDYRTMLFRTKNLGDYISGAILFDETVRQKAADGTSLVDLLKQNNIIPGIKVDTGAKPMAGFPGEMVTEGLDGLRDRLAEYGDLGARFAKWRAVIVIGSDSPSPTAIRANAHALARYAALCQEAGLVPIVEPEILMDGDHDIGRCEAATAMVLQAVYAELAAHHVVLEATLLKPNMVISGQACPRQAAVEEVAEKTITCLKAHVPAAVAGIVFLSGGQSDRLASAHLNAMQEYGPLPWPLSFSYGRALQQSALRAWGGDPGQEAAAQAALLHRAQMNSLATQGRYQSDLDQAA